MGLFWSLLPAPQQERGTRFVKQDATEPAEFSFSVYNDHLDCEALRTMQPVAATTAQKWFMRPGDVERIKVHSGRVIGVLFKPRGLHINYYYLLVSVCISSLSNRVSPISSERYRKGANNTSHTNVLSLLVRDIRKTILFSSRSTETLSKPFVNLSWWNVRQLTRGAQWLRAAEIESVQKKCALLLQNYKEVKRTLMI